jgi:ABC transporter substrate binding protein (PQQ-dependent alcohol dehydrogenase system)
MPFALGSQLLGFGEKLLVSALAVCAFGALAMAAGAADKLHVTVDYLEIARPHRPTLSNLVTPPADRGLQGARLAVHDNNTTGRFLGHDYRLVRHLVPAGADWKPAIAALMAGPARFVVVNAPAKALAAIASWPDAANKLLFNVGSGDDALRRTLCLPHLFHTLPSRAMRADALIQFLVARRWTRLMLVTGHRPGDKKFAASLKRAIAKFGAKLVAEKPWLRDVDIRRSAGREVPRFTQGVDYDVLLIADEDRDFGQYFLFNTWLPRPVAGSHGLRPVAWSRVVEQWGAAQLQRRFHKIAGRDMTSVDYAAWAAVRSVGVAVTRLRTLDVDKLGAFIRSPRFELGGFKGRKLTYRAWNGQLRQPIPLVSASAVAATAPIAGYLHRRTELDTLGFDKAETTCGR